MYNNTIYLHTLTNILMKQIISFILILISTIFVVWCERTSQYEYTDQWPMLDMSDPIVITDPQILAEIKFMKEENWISEETYQMMLRRDEIFHIEWTGLEWQGYHSCFYGYCDTVFPRVSVRSAMAERSLALSLIAVWLPIKVSDPQVLEELRYFRDRYTLWWDTYEILIRMDNIPMTSASGEYYPWCFASWCNAKIYRSIIQEKMNEWF